MSGGKARAALVLLPTMARLNDHQRIRWRERLDAFHKLLLGIILHGRMGVHGAAEHRPSRVLLAAWTSDDSLR